MHSRSSRPYDSHYGGGSSSSRRRNSLYDNISTRIGDDYAYSFRTTTPPSNFTYTRGPTSLYDRPPRTISRDYTSPLDAARSSPPRYTSTRRTTSPYRTSYTRTTSPLLHRSSYRRTSSPARRASSPPTRRHRSPSPSLTSRLVRGFGRTMTEMPRDRLEEFGTAFGSWAGDRIRSSESRFWRGVNDTESLPREEVRRYGDAAGRWTGEWLGRRAGRR
ncbi:hypothetical protein VTJ49DRAFT_4292 [Mycothermus thermophilus]|uniref:Uncharacterized protein n=1 Tax=Humicola insolens TaxID=85995 RepID=A0ABR3V5T3_HUMIN